MSWFESALPWALSPAISGTLALGDLFSSPSSPSQSGMPQGYTIPKYEVGYDPNSPENIARKKQQEGLFAGQQRAIGDVRGYAENKGDSPWAMMQKKQSFEQEKMARDQAAAKGAAMAAEGRSSLAQSGGLTSGARERLAAGGAKNAMDMGQDVSREGNQGRLQIGVNDAQGKIQALQALPGMEQGALSSWTAFDNAETNRITDENRRRNDFNTRQIELENQRIMNQKYVEEMQRQQEAAKKGGIFGHGGFLGTGL